VVGLLRGGSRGSKGAGMAEVSTPGHAAVLRGTREMLRVDLPAQAVAGGQSLSINEMRGPVCTTVGAGKYTLRQVFGLRAAHAPDPCIGLAASAEFAPAPALAPRWLSRSEPFHGASKRKFGFRVLLQVVPE
jgi:hypothetical protein